MRGRIEFGRLGVSLGALAELSESIGFRSLVMRVPTALVLGGEVPLPCVVHWDERHYVVVYAIDRRGRVVIGDPATGVHRVPADEFRARFASAEHPDSGMVLMLEATPALTAPPGDDERDGRSAIRFLWGYVRPHRRYMLQIVIGLVVGAAMSLVMPFLTQALIDHGVALRDLGFVQMILLAQLAIFAGRLTIDFLRSWLVLHVGARMNLALVSDFLSHLMRLPMPFFDARAAGDVLQRVDDHRRIEALLSSTLLTLLVAVVTLAVYAVVLGLYSIDLLGVFLAGSALAIVWPLIFMRRRRVLDQRAFGERAAGQNALVEIVAGMSEIKLANSELHHRWRWERVQARLVRVVEQQLQLGQLQQAGSIGINELKNILLTIMAATEVIHGTMSLGMMLAVSYILGQAGRPVDTILSAVIALQDSKVSLERIDEIRSRPLEVQADEQGVPPPANGDIELSGVSFAYPGGADVLHGIDLTLKAGQVTAIVGTSGSGKTTLLKLLLRFIEPREGAIRVGGLMLPTLDLTAWRKRCGVVMQGGHIFSESVARNISLGDDATDLERMYEVARIARIEGFVQALPRGYHTPVGPEGVGLSQGQRQRLLIARALYKQPDYIMLDEATSALDAGNERAIVDGLSKAFAGRTAVVIAHRLSTVRNADHIVVLEGGRIVEQGDHAALVARRGRYFELVRDQLELGA